MRTLICVNPETHKISEHFMEEAIAKGLEAPAHVRVVTYTTRLNRCFWVTVEELEKHYERAEVDGKREGNRSAITTRNVARIRIDGPGSVSLDGQEFPSAGVFVKVNSKWAKGRAERSEKGLRKAARVAGTGGRRFCGLVPVRPSDGERNRSYGMRPRSAGFFYEHWK